MLNHTLRIFIHVILQRNMLEFWDIVISVVSGIIAGVIVVIGMRFWDKECGPYIEGKTVNFSLEDKTMLRINGLGLVFAAVLIGIGIVFVSPLIQAQGLPEISEDDHETQRYYKYLEIQFIIGMIFVIVGFIWAGLNLRTAKKLFLTNASRKTKPKSKSKKTKPKGENP